MSLVRVETPMSELLDLRRICLFEDLDESALELVSSIVEYRRCPPESTLVEAGSSDRSLFIVYRGSIRIVKLGSDGQESAIAEVLPGQHVGEVTFVVGGHRTATAITNEAAELLVIDPWRFRKLAESHPRIAHRICWNLLRVLCRRLRDTDHWLFELMQASCVKVG